MCPLLSGGREPSSARRFVYCGAKGEKLSRCVSVPPGRQPSCAASSPAAPPPAKPHSPPLFPPGRHAMPRGFCSPSPRAGERKVLRNPSAHLPCAGQTAILHNHLFLSPSQLSDSRAKRACRPSGRTDNGLVQQNARAMPWQVGCQTAAQSAPVTPRPDRRRFCECKMPQRCCGKSDVKQPRRARLSSPGRTGDGFANAKCQGSALASWMSDSHAKRVCHSQTGQTMVLRTQNAAAVLRQIGCQTAARSAPVAPRPDRQRFCEGKMPGQRPGKSDVKQPRKARLSPPGRAGDGFANAKCRSYAAANRLSNSRAERACQACSSKRISS